MTDGCPVSGGRWVRSTTGGPGCTIIEGDVESRVGRKSVSGPERSAEEVTPVRKWEPIVESESDEAHELIDDAGNGGGAATDMGEKETSSGRMLSKECIGLGVRHVRLEALDGVALEKEVLGQGVSSL